MADLYRAHLAQAGTEAEREARVEAQRAWNRSRIGECRLDAGGSKYESAEECIGNLYASRIVDLHHAVTPVPPDGVLNQGMSLAPRNPAAADALLTDQPSIIAKLERMLYLHAFAPPFPERDVLIRGIKEKVDGLARLSLESHTMSLAEEIAPHDGDDESLVPTLRAIVQSGIAMGTVPYLIPCNVLQRRPGLLMATEPYFGGNRDIFLPRSGCGWGRGQVEGFPEGPVRSFVAASTTTDGDFIGTNEGSLRFTLAAAQAAAIERLAFHPGENIAAAPPVMGEPLMRPYHVWSYLAVANHRAWPAIDAAYAAAHAALSAFMVAQGWFPDPRSAEPAARLGLFQAVLGADCGGTAPPRSLRTLVLDGADERAIRAFIETGDWRDAARLEPFTLCAKDGGRDPLIHLAVTRPKLLDILSETASGLDVDIAVTLDAEMGVEATNGFGKTPLMSAAQWDSLGGVDWLLAKGADVNATTKVGDEWEFPRHGRRTALMYAAASASLGRLRVVSARPVSRVLPPPRPSSAWPCPCPRG